VGCCPFSKGTNQSYKFYSNRGLFTFQRSRLNNVVPIAGQNNNDQKQACCHEPIKTGFSISQAPLEPLAEYNTEQQSTDKRADSENPSAHISSLLSRAFGAGFIAGFLGGVFVCFVLMAALCERRDRRLGRETLSSK